MWHLKLTSLLSKRFCFLLAFLLCSRALFLCAFSSALAVYCSYLLRIVHAWANTRCSAVDNFRQVLPTPILLLRKLFGFLSLHFRAEVDGAKRTQRDVVLPVAIIVVTRRLLQGRSPRRAQLNCGRNAG